MAVRKQHWLAMAGGTALLIGELAPGSYSDVGTDTGLVIGAIQALYGLIAIGLGVTARRTSSLLTPAILATAAWGILLVLAVIVSVDEDEGFSLLTDGWTAIATFVGHGLILWSAVVDRRAPATSVPGGTH